MLCLWSGLPRFRCLIYFTQTWTKPDPPQKKKTKKKHTHRENISYQMLATLDQIRPYICTTYSCLSMYIVTGMNNDIEPGLGPNCLQRLAPDDTSRKNS